jgi:2-deoxy-D-gluconate 3-dehydrogenase
MNLPAISELIDLNGKTAIVTGGTMGIGFGIAYRLAEAGANVVIADLNEEVGNRAASELTGSGFQIAFIRSDVCIEEDVRDATNFAVKTYGGIDILVNNAGTYPSIPALQMTLADFDKIIAVNLKGVFLFTKAVAEVMIKQGRGGKIINITSIDALHPSAVGLAAYDATKQAVWGFTKNIALEFAPNHIQVNAVAPGGINTSGPEVRAPRWKRWKRNSWKKYR